MPFTLPSNTRYIQELPHLRQGAAFTTVAVINAVIPHQSPSAGEMLRIELSDRTGCFSAVLFRNSSLYAALSQPLPDTAFLIRGTADQYNGGFSPKLIAVDPLPPDVTNVLMERVVKCSSRPYQGLLAEWKVAVNSVSVAAASAIEAVIAEVSPHFFSSPAGIQVHHAYRHGLLEHTLNVKRLAEMLIASYPDLSINRDAAVCAILVHDAFKCREYTQGFRTELTPVGLLNGHIVLAYHAWLNHAAAHAVPEPFRAEVAHCILAHHGALENGSPVSPRTPTAWVVHYADLVDAKMGAIHAALERDGHLAITTRSAGLDRMVISHAARETATDFPLKMGV